MVGAPHRPLGSSEFASSDYVRVELDSEILEMLQESHGGWNAAMCSVCIAVEHFLFSLLPLGSIIIMITFPTFVPFLCWRAGLIYVHHVWMLLLVKCPAVCITI